jgi:hypothetical protein
MTTVPATQTRTQPKSNPAAGGRSRSIPELALERSATLPTITPWEGKRSASQSAYLLEQPLPGRRQPVKAASREAGARHAPALRGWRWSGLLGFKQARLSAHSPSPRDRANDQSTPPPGMAMPEIYCPTRLSSTGCHGTSLKPRPPSPARLSIIANRPLDSCVERQAGR